MSRLSSSANSCLRWRCVFVIARYLARADITTNYNAFFRSGVHDAFRRGLRNLFTNGSLSSARAAPNIPPKTSSRRKSIISN